MRKRVKWSSIRIRLLPKRMLIRLSLNKWLNIPIADDED